MKMGLVIKVLMMVLSLAAVLYGIKALKSPSVQQKADDPNSFVGLLIGGDQRMLNWCPEGVTSVELYSDSGEISRVLTSKQDISAVCELMIGGFSMEGGQEPVYKLRLRALTEGSGNPVSLEQAQGTAIFRVKGMPFSCPGLMKILERFNSP
ncbi:hypothetical protein QJS83_08380 [Bdellovibrio sp. 22V]|uniref:hypothetical protein n=1 Tax=Bdellovibrio TaxID=958 RepID=UPI002543764F|nr:hypothetical protein [Bdellovibrio sp. 22V]WII73891.1 hypothetical protein QJS83_08380 [Bdellovibrio sp. 22V]